MSTYPITVPPNMAPRFATTCVTVILLEPNSSWFSNMVGYKSCDPCDYSHTPSVQSKSARKGDYMLLTIKLNPAIKSTK